MAENNVYMAKLAEQAERYEEMVEYMKTVAKDSKEDLSLEERNLLSVAYKNVVGARRASLRIIGSILAKEESKGDQSKVRARPRPPPSTHPFRCPPSLSPTRLPSSPPTSPPPPFPPRPRSPRLALANPTTPRHHR